MTMDEGQLRWENNTLTTVKLHGNKYSLLKVWHWQGLEILHVARVYT